MYITPVADLPASERPGNSRPEMGDSEFSDLFACLMVLTGEAEDRCDLVSLGSARPAGEGAGDDPPEETLIDPAVRLEISPPLPTPDIAAGSAMTAGAGQELAISQPTSPAALVAKDAEDSDLRARKETAALYAPQAEEKTAAEQAPPELAVAEPLPANVPSAELTASITPASVSEMTATAAASRPVVASSLLPGTAGSAEWQHSLSQQIVCFVREGVHHAELRLQPESLGPIQISLHVNNDQVEVSFVAAHPQTREALDCALPLLRHSLSALGMALGESQISGDKSDASHLFHDRGKQPPRSRQLVDIPDSVPLESLHTGSEYGLSYRSVNIFV